MLLLFSVPFAIWFFKLYRKNNAAYKEIKALADSGKLVWIVKTRIRQFHAARYESGDLYVPNANVVEFSLEDGTTLKFDSMKVFRQIDYPHTLWGQECYYFVFNNEPINQLYMSYDYCLARDVQPYVTNQPRRTDTQQIVQYLPKNEDYPLSPIPDALRGCRTESFFDNTGF